MHMHMQEDRYTRTVSKARQISSLLSLSARRPLPELSIERKVCCAHSIPSSEGT